MDDVLQVPYELGRYIGGCEIEFEEDLKEGPV